MKSNKKLKEELGKVKPEESGQTRVMARRDEMVKLRDWPYLCRNRAQIGDK